eukprot:SAG31_NODE_1882_length_7000_cov_3.469932_7_plen_60_part_00
MGQQLGNRCIAKEVCESTGREEMQKRSIQRASTEFIERLLLIKSLIPTCSLPLAGRARS